MRARAGLSGQVMKAKQHVRRDRVAGGQGAVGPRLAARDQLLLVVRREEVATARAVVEAGVEGGHQLARPLEVHPITGGLVEVEERARQEGVVVQVGAVLRASARPPVEQLPPGPQARPDELRRRARRLDEASGAEHPPGLGERPDHEAVPAGQDLLVARRRNALPACGQQPDAGPLERCHRVAGAAAEHPGDLLDGQGDVRDALPLEVPLVGDVPVAADQVDVVGVDDPGHLRGGPDEVLPLLALAVGVGGGVEAAFGMPHVAQHVVERLLDDAAEFRLARHLVGLEVEPRELRVVVEHLLEVRHEPTRVHGVAVKAASDLVVHAALRHPVAGEEHRFEQRRVAGRAVLPQEELEGGRVRELGRPAEPAVGAVDVREESLRGTAREGGVEGALGRLGALEAREAGENLLDRLGDVCGALPVGARHGLEHAREAG